MKNENKKIRRLHVGEVCTPEYLEKVDGLMIDSRMEGSGVVVHFFLPFEEINDAIIRSAFALIGHEFSKGRGGK